MYHKESRLEVMEYYCLVSLNLNRLKQRNNRIKKISRIT